MTAEGDLIIYPAVDPVALPAEPSGDRTGGTASIGRGTGDEVLGVRPMREGDDPRDIYWRKSTHHMVLRERGRETRRDVKHRDRIDAHGRGAHGRVERASSGASGRSRRAPSRT